MLLRRLLSSQTARAVPTTSLRAAFVGAGDIAQLHAEGVARTDGIDLVGIWSRPGCPVVTEPERVARKFGCRLYENAEDIANDPDIDVVYVLTNAETHAQYAIDSMNRGKHVIVEKPVASSLDELRAMKSAAEANGVVLFPGHNYIYEPWFHRTRALIQNGDLGDLVTLNVMYNIFHADEFFSRDSILGVIRQIGTHLAYMSIFLGGKPAEITAMKSSIGTSVKDKENLVMVLMKMESGAIAHLTANYAADDHGADPWSVYTKVLGTKGSARYSYNDWVLNKRLENSAHSHTYVPYPETVRNETSFFVDECMGKGRAPLSTIDDAILCMKIIEGIEDSIQSKSSVVIKP